MSDERPRLNILLIEDCPRRLKLTRQALERARTRCRLHTVGSGGDSTRYLQQIEPYGSAPVPDLVMFDFTSADPRQLDLLEELKSLEMFRKTPLVLLTLPDGEALLEEQYESRPDRVMFSPIELSGFLGTMNSLSKDRFKNAVSLISNLGFVLVRAPVEFAENGEAVTMSRAM